ncbi:MAG: MoaD/ThiS family protein [Spirochaetaceae bacterium]|nr:MAG: MoaD/ThiS family protein [Spirochaetaceae bacterium]
MNPAVTITVECSPILKLKDIQNRGEIKVPADTSITTLLDRLGVPTGQHRYLLVYANGRKQGLNYIVQNGDALQLFLPIGGG